MIVNDDIPAKLRKLANDIENFIIAPVRVIETADLPDNSGSFEVLYIVIDNEKSQS